jgi:hypothetical protein
VKQVYTRQKAAVIRKNKRRKNWMSYSNIFVHTPDGATPTTEKTTEGCRLALEDHYMPEGPAYRHLDTYSEQTPIPVPTKKNQKQHAVLLYQNVYSPTDPPAKYSIEGFTTKRRTPEYHPTSPAY